MKTITLSDLSPGYRARVLALYNDEGMRRRLLDIGITQNAEVECIGRSPGGDPSAYRIRGAVIALRHADARHILVRI